MMTWHTTTKEFAKQEPVKVSFENRHGSYIIETKQPTETIQEVRDNLLVPLLCAAGFSEKLVNELFFEE